MVERIAFNTSHFAGMLALRMSGGPPGGGVSSTSGGMNQMERMMEGGFMSTTGILVGLAVTAVFLGGAIWLRRYRAPN